MLFLFNYAIGGGRKEDRSPLSFSPSTAPIEQGKHLTNYYPLSLMSTVHLQWKRVVCYISLVEIKAVFQYTLPVLRIYSIRDVNYRFSVAVNIGTWPKVGIHSPFLFLNPF